MLNKISSPSHNYGMGGKVETVFFFSVRAIVKVMFLIICCEWVCVFSSASKIKNDCT